MTKVKLTKRQMEMLEALQYAHDAESLGRFVGAGLSYIKRTLEQLNNKGLIRIDLEGWKVEFKNGSFDYLPEWRKR